MNERRSRRRPSLNLGGNLYMLTGLLVGIGLGLLYSWILSPVEYVDTAPISLRADFKDQYRAAIASSYLATGDLARSQARLALLGDPDPLQALSAQAQSAWGAGDPYGSAYALAYLAQALGQPPETPLPSLTPVFHSPTATMPSPTAGPPTVTSPVKTPVRPATAAPTLFQSPTPRPSRTPTPTAGAPLQLASQETVCDPALAEGLLQVEVLDAAGQPVAGAGIVINWPDGESRFFTGLKPELGDGYADFLMTPNVAYSLQVTGAGVLVTGLSVPDCQGEGGDFWGGLRLVFRQP